MTDGMVRPPIGPRRIGAIAGLTPAAVIVGYYVMTGGPITPGLGVIAAVAVVAGWLVGPLSRGPLRADLVAMAAYFVAGYLLNLAIGAVISISEDVLGGLVGGPLMVIESVVRLVLPALIYLPVWAIFLMPVALVWIVTLRALRSRLSAHHGAMPEV